MNILARTIISGLAAFVVTTGLALLMAKIIYVPFVALPDKPEKMSFTINPEIIEAVPIKNNRPQKLAQIVSPPPSPIIDRQKTTKPTGPIFIPFFPIPSSKKFKPSPTNITLSISDPDAKAILKIQPIMPPRADKSGHCKVRFNVTAQGQPYEVMVTYCTQSVFKRPTIKAVQKWKYRPKVRNRIAVARYGVESLITFNLVDERGDLIPE